MTKLSVVKRTTFEKFLLSVGCQKKRQKGSHIIYTRKDLDRPVVIVAQRELSFTVVRSNLRTLGISVDEFLEIINQL